MTVTYTAQVATCTGLGCFWKLLFRWRGSIYKLLWPNLIVYSIVYFSLSGVYRFILNEEHRLLFEKIALHCQAYGDLIPIAFVLGFYVSIVIKRWWDQYICMPWPDNLAMFVSTLVHGQDDRGRLMRRTIIRYVNLCLVITLRMMSPRVKKRFPTMDHLVEAGFLQPNEKKIFEDLDSKTTHPKYWMPLVWAGGIITRARKENRVKDDFSMKTLIDGLNHFRGGCGGMLNYDWISIPLVYTQVVTLAVYTYFMATLMGNQFLDPAKGYAKHDVDLVVPVFTFLQFFFYMGWLKVAESLVNPFGEDDDDFELNWLVDRNLQVSYVIVDEMHQEHPEMVKDQYWDEVFPAELPYTAASKQYQTGPPPPSTENVEVSLEQAEFMPLETVNEEPPEDADDLVDIELDDEVTGTKAERRETHPMQIMKRQKSESINSINVSSFSGPRTQRKSSVMNLLTKMFRRNESNKDLVSQMGSSISLPSRKGQRSGSRMSSMSQSQAQSRTSIVRENTFQDEMFHMSDVSLAGSVLTTGSQIQIVVPRDSESRQRKISGDEFIDEESSEVAQLIPVIKEKETPRRISFSTDKPLEADFTSADLSVADDASDASGSSIKTSFYQESLAAVNDISEFEVATSPPQKVLAETHRQGTPKTRNSDWKEVYTLPSSFTDTNHAADGPSAMTRVIMPCSPPVRHIFTSVTPPVASNVTKSVKRKKSTTKKEKESGSPLVIASCLSRSIQQHHQPSETEKWKQQIADTQSNQPLETPLTDQNLPDMINGNNAAPSQINFTPIVTLLSPTQSFISTSPVETVSSALSVSLPSNVVPTTTIVTTVSAFVQPTVTVTSPSSAASLSCSTVLHIPQDKSASTEEAKVSSSPPSVTITVEEPPVPPPPDALPDSEQEVSHVGSAQYVPSAAIPVPAMSPAHATSVSEGYELIEAAMAPMTRRTHHDFHELEPISEHGETVSESPMTGKNRNTDNQTIPEFDGGGSESIN